MQANQLIEKVKNTFDRSSFKRNNPLEQRVQMHRDLVEKCCKAKNRDPEDYVFVVIEPAPLLARTIEAERQKKNQGMMTFPPLYKMYRCNQQSLMMRKDVTVAASVIPQIRKVFNYNSKESLHIFNYEKKSLINVSSYQCNVDESAEELYKKIHDQQDDFIYLEFNTTDAF